MGVDLARIFDPPLYPPPSTCQGSREIVSEHELSGVQRFVGSVNVKGRFDPPASSPQDNSERLAYRSRARRIARGGGSHFRGKVRSVAGLQAMEGLPVKVFEHAGLKRRGARQVWGSTAHHEGDFVASRHCCSLRRLRVLVIFYRRCELSIYSTDSVGKPLAGEAECCYC